jgi:hypothetical protein
VIINRVVYFFFAFWSDNVCKNLLYILSLAVLYYAGKKHVRFSREEMKIFTDTCCIFWLSCILLFSSGPSLSLFLSLTHSLNILIIIENILYAFMDLT